MFTFQIIHIVNLNVVVCNYKVHSNEKKVEADSDLLLYRGKTDLRCV